MVEINEADEPFPGYGLMKSIVGKRMATCELRNFQLFDDQYSPKREAALKQVVAYAKNLPANVKAGRNLILSGPIGTGKDHLAVSVIRVAIGCRISCKYITGSELCEELKAQSLGQDNSVYRYRHIELLVVSDIEPKGFGSSEFQRQALLNLINERYMEMRPTIVTTNLATRREMLDVLDDRLVDRLLHEAVVVITDWPTERKRHGVDRDAKNKDAVVQQ